MHRIRYSKSPRTRWSPISLPLLISRRIQRHFQRQCFNVTRYPLCRNNVSCLRHLLRIPRIGQGVQSQQRWYRLKSPLIQKEIRLQYPWWIASCLFELCKIFQRSCGCPHRYLQLSRFWNLERHRSWKSISRCWSHLFRNQTRLRWPLRVFQKS